MTDPNPQPNGDTQRLIDIRADLVGALAQIERLMEAKGIPVESAIVTRRERRHLTKRARKRNM